MKLYNTLTKKVEEFRPINPDLVTLYACGPTVYDYVHIGNLRTFTLTDILVRTLRYLGYNVKYVMNITDVGHLVSDADSGDDKLEKGAKREGKTAWDVATFYTEAFLSDSKKMNLLDPDVRPKPTQHIPEQIAMVQKLIDKGFAYTIDDGVYFDTGKLSDYGKLTGQHIEELRAGARVEVNPQKKTPTDFALWKFSNPKGVPLKNARGPLVKRQMEWESPFGIGFPGWHIECSAMSMKYLGEQLDIHTGGADLIPIHHSNEIAQSEAATGKVPFVAYWVHGQFILVDSEKMAKSKGNFYRLSDVEAKGFDPLALRYFYFTAHYRMFLNFTWEALTAAQNALKELHGQLSAISQQLSDRTMLSQEKLQKVDLFREKFKITLEDDFNMPQALAVLWEVIKSNIPSQDKLDLVLEFDEILGLNLKSQISMTKNFKDVPKEVKELLKKREALRQVRKFDEADAVRKEIENKGYILEDTSSGPVISQR